MNSEKNETNLSQTTEDTPKLEPTEIPVKLEEPFKDRGFAFEVKIQYSKNESTSYYPQELQLDRKSSKGCRKLVEWTIQENITLFDKFIEIGSKWVQLSHHLPEKSDNAVKNRFYCCLRKVQKKINKVQKGKKIMIKRLISFDSLLTILEIGKFGSNSFDKRFDQISFNAHKIMDVRDRIVEFAKLPEDLIEDSAVEDLIYRFLDFKHCLKFLNIERVKKSAKKANTSRESEVSCLISERSAQEQHIQHHDNDMEMHLDGNFFDVDRLQNELNIFHYTTVDQSLFKSYEEAAMSSQKKTTSDLLYLF